MLLGFYPLLCLFKAVYIFGFPSPILLFSDCFLLMDPSGALFPAFLDTHSYKRSKRGFFGKRVILFAVDSTVWTWPNSVSEIVFGSRQDFCESTGPTTRTDMPALTWLLSAQFSRILRSKGPNFFPIYLTNVYLANYEHCLSSRTDLWALQRMKVLITFNGKSNNDFGGADQCDEPASALSLEAGV